MSSRWLVVFVAVLLASPGNGPAREKAEEPIPAQVIQVVFPAGDVSISIVETKKGKAVRVSVKDSSVQAKRVYLGDGNVAVEVEATEDGVRINGKKGGLTSNLGYTFEKGSIIAILPGQLKAGAVKAGEVYATVPGIEFVLEK